MRWPLPWARRRSRLPHRRRPRSAAARCRGRRSIWPPCAARWCCWSTDCPVCLDKLPELRRNLEGWRGRDFVIVAVNQDRVGTDLQHYLRIRDRVAPPDAQMPVVWRRDPAHRDDFGELPARAPTTIVLDRLGRVVLRQHGRVPTDLWNDIADLVLN